MAPAARTPTTVPRNEDCPLEEALIGSPLESPEDDVWVPLAAENVLELADVVGDATLEPEAAESLPEPELPPTAAVVSLVESPDVTGVVEILVSGCVEAV